MKFPIMLAVLMLSVSCGKKVEKYAIENNFDDSKINEKIADLATRVYSLELKVESSIVTIESLEQSLLDTQDFLDAQIAALEEVDADHQAEIQSLITQGTNAYNALMDDITEAQADVNNALSQLAVLNGYDNVVAFIDPCPTVPTTGYREVLMKTSSGKLVAYFESGSQRHLSPLVNGVFRSTDSRACNFTVQNGNVI